MSNMKTIREYMDLLDDVRKSGNDTFYTTPEEYLSDYSGTTPKFSEFVNEFYKQALSKNITPTFKVRRRKDGKVNSGLIVRTSPNKPEVSLSVGATGTPTIIRIGIGTMSDENRENLFTALKDAFGLGEINTDGGKPSISVAGNSPEEQLKLFWNAVNIVNGDPAVALNANSSKGLITPSDLKFYRGIYQDFENAVRHGAEWTGGRGPSDARNHLMFLGITPEARKSLEKWERGEQVAKKDQPYREHAVPWTMIRSKGIEMIKQGRQEAGKLTGEVKEQAQRQLKRAVIDLLKYNLLIVITTEKQGNDLDSSAVHNLKTTMPQVDGQEWDFAMNKPLARFRKAGYKVEDLTDRDRELLGSYYGLGGAKMAANKARRETPLPYKDKDKPERVDIDNLEEELPQPLPVEPISDNPKVLGRTRRNAINEFTKD